MSISRLGTIPKQVVQLQRNVTPTIIRKVARQTGKDYSDVKAQIEELRNPQEPLAQLLATEVNKQ